jgi:hypothetical protein
MNKRNKKMLNEIELDKWLETLLSELKTNFGARLLRYYPLLERWSSGMFDRLSDVKIETAFVD